jgi:glycosyltransferase involved in cell wall biosynthesis
LKILQVTPFFAPVHGGSAEAPFQIARELVRRGHEVTVYTSDYRLGREYVNALGGAEIVAFKTFLNLMKFLVTPAMGKRLGKDISRFDIVHLHNFFTYQNVLACRYARRRGVPYVLQAHGSAATYFQRGSLKKMFHALWGRRILEGASCLLAVTPMEAKQYQTLGVDWDKIKIIQHGIDLSEFDNLPPRGEFRKRYNIGADDRVVLFLGRIDRVKGLDLLVKAFNGIKNNLANSTLVIAGPDDGFLPELKPLVRKFGLENAVVFTGLLQGRDKLEAYVDADVFVLPSSYEIFGITILEALACGTPVVVTDRCGLAEAVEGEGGLVVPYQVEPLRDAVIKLLKDDKLRQECIAKGRSLVRERFAWSSIIKQIENVYASCLSD